MLKKISTFIMALILSLPGCASVSLESTPESVDSDLTEPRLGLYVEDGIIKHNGEEYRSIGVNFFSCFTNAFETGSKQYEEIFALMNEYDIEYARISIGPFWPVNYTNKSDNEQLYKEVMDTVIKSAEQHNIGLIISFFWHAAGLSDFCGEPVNAWGDPESKTRKYMTDYVTTIVERYSESPTIWGWEFGNEINLSVDLPNRTEHRPQIIAELGTRLTRDENDDFSTDFVQPLLIEFAELVRKLDPHRRIITSGCAEPRPSQWNQYKYDTWTADTREQMAETLTWHNPTPMDTVSVHTYDLLNRFSGTESYADWLGIVKAEAKTQGKALFVGEFSANEGTSEEIIDAIVTNKIPLAAVWAIGSVEYSLDTNPTRRADVLDYIKQANIELKK